MKKITIYDTTLRDGSQAEGISFSVADKIAIARRLDDLGVDYIEGGQPGSNVKERSFFEEIREVPLQHAKIVAFGPTRRRDKDPEKDAGIAALLASGAGVLAIVAKSWDLHVREVLGVTLAENLRMISDTVSYLKKHGKEVVLDAEHFFDGYKANPEYALQTLETAAQSGADAICLCDTNGGCLPGDVAEIVRAARAKVKKPLGIHGHNDGGLAVANSLAAVQEGAGQVQGTINGIGERCGNADLCQIIPALRLKLGLKCLLPDSLRKLTEVSRYVYEAANISSQAKQPYVGESAFAHKGGLHTDAVRKNTKTYEHVDPALVGNERRFLISELSGTSTILAKTGKYGLAEDREAMGKILRAVQELEHQGYHFEAAEASFEILVQKILNKHRKFFELEDYKVLVHKREDGATVNEATVKVRVGTRSQHTVSEGDGPVNALDNALRKALEPIYPTIRDMKLVDYKVRVINEGAGTAAKVRVIINSSDGQSSWGTVGVSENIIEASWIALVDSIEYKLWKDGLR